MDASEDAAVEEVPGEECSASMVVLLAMQELDTGVRESEVGYDGTHVLEKGTGWARGGCHCAGFGGCLG